MLQAFTSHSYTTKLKECYTAYFSMESLPPDHPKRKLLDQVRDAIRLKHYSYRTEQSYVAWIRRYILFHNKRHPKDMGSLEVEAFLTHLAITENVAASTSKWFDIRTVQELLGHKDVKRLNKRQPCILFIKPLCAIQRFRQ